MRLWLAASRSRRAGAVAEARTARREERLYQELARLERMIDLIKRMWAILNRAFAWRATVEAGADAVALATHRATAASWGRSTWSWA